MFQTIILIGNLGKEPEMRYTQRPAGRFVLSRYQPQLQRRGRAAGEGNHLVPRDGVGQAGGNL